MAMIRYPLWNSKLTIIIDVTLLVREDESFINLTIFSKNTYVTVFLGSFQTPNLYIPPYNKYVTYLTAYVGYIRRATKPTVSVPVMWISFDS